MTKPKLKDISGLFGLGDSLDSRTSYQKDLPIEQLKPFHAHPFALYTGERLDDLVESIQKSGVMQPILVQAKGRFYEILAGHNRTNAAKLAGLETIPAIIIEDLSDEEALAYVIESNVMQRSFTELSHSEKAAVIALHHSQMFSQGKRNDIQGALEEMTKGHKKRNPTTTAKSHTNENIGEQYALSKNTIARYLRISKLNFDLKEKLDQGRIAFIPAVNVSFLTESEQTDLNLCLEESKQKLDVKKAELLRTSSQKNTLDMETIRAIVENKNKVKPQKLSLPSEILSSYFTNGENKEEIVQTIEKALSQYFNN